ncbi:MAG TPA: hypothetical protein PLK99_00350 [Burkholderiales bacterium]|nr:hypothetical protein [Burkholderiales bacterium]
MMTPLRHPISVLLCAFALLSPLSAEAGELIVIVNAESGVSHLTRSQVINIFLGRNREFPNGRPAVPVDMPAGNPTKALFYRVLVNRDLDQMAAYWSRFVFAGSTAPPLQAKSEQDVIKFVSTHPDAVGYLEGSLSDNRVKAVLTLK